MSLPLDYQRSPEPDASPEDVKLLRGITAVNRAWGFTCFLLFGLPFALSLCMLPFHGFADEPGVSGLRMVLVMLGLSTPGVLVGALTILSARRIARRRRLAFSVRWSLLCMCLGVLALPGL